MNYPEKRPTPPPFSRNLTAMSTATGSSIRLPNQPALIVWREMHFLVMDAPSESNLHLYLQEMQHHNVTSLVRVCEPTYPRDAVDAQGISLYDWVFPDGEGPSDDIIDAWLNLVSETFQENNPLKRCIAVHCVAGLGR